jgi:hypothetical protein
MPWMHLMIGVLVSLVKKYVYCKSDIKEVFANKEYDTTHERKTHIVTTCCPIYFPYAKPYSCTVPSDKDENCPTSPFKQMPISPFTITILCDAQSTLYSCVISINHAKFHSTKTKTPFIMNVFISFSLFYVKIDQEMLVMNFKDLIAHLCRKHHCTQHTLTRNLKNL